MPLISFSAVIMMMTTRKPILVLSGKPVGGWRTKATFSVVVQGDTSICHPLVIKSSRFFFFLKNTSMLIIWTCFGCCYWGLAFSHGTLGPWAKVTTIVRSSVSKALIYFVLLASSSSFPLFFRSPFTTPNFCSCRPTKSDYTNHLARLNKWE